MKVAFVSQPEYFRFCYEKDLDTLWEVREFPFHFGMDEAGLDSLIAYAPEVTFFFRGEFVPQAVLKKLSGIKIAISSEPFPRDLNGRIEYTLDSVKRYLDFRSRIRRLPYDYVFHYDVASLDYMAKDGIHCSGAFPFPVATNTYRPNTGMPNAWDIFFIGRSTEHRERFFGPLKHHRQFLHICHGIFGPPLIKYIQKAKINLNVHAEDEISWEPRMQMLLAAGAFVISEPITPNNILRPGLDYVEARTPAEMYQLTEYYLAHDAEREAIAASGRNRVAEYLAAQTSFPKLMDAIQRGDYPRFEAGAPRRVINVLDATLKQLSRLAAIFRSWS